MAYSKALALLSAKQRKTINDVLLLWRHTDQKLKAIAGNLQSEVNLPVSLHARFLRELARVWYGHSADPSATALGFRQVCAKYQLRGARLLKRRIKFVGQASALGNLCTRWADALRRAGATRLDAKHIEARIRNVATLFRINPAAASTRLQSLMNDLHAAGLHDLTRTPTWCTFVLPNGVDEPFLAPLNTAAAIHNGLGLDPSDAKRELLLFVYPRLPHIFHKPTMADASLHPYFTPAAKRHDHGWTTPHDRAAVGGLPQPEAVHLAIAARPTGFKIILA